MDGATQNDTLSTNADTTIVNDPKKTRKAVFRRTIDYNAAIINYLRQRIYAFDWKERSAIQADYLYNFKVCLSLNYWQMLPPCCYLDNPMTCVTSKLVRTSTNKNKCPIYCVCVSFPLLMFKWTPEGRRLITGAFSGEFTLWNGLTFNFETILQAHESQIRCMKWSYNDEWLLTADHSGYVKYWQENMNNVEVYQAHKEPIRGVSFCPFDSKFTTCSDDSTVRIWDFNRCAEERVLRGHGADVRCVAWHPQMSLIISGSKDAQQPIKLWEPKTGEAISTLYVHKSTCTDVAWNKNGNWFLTASRDHSVKLFDIRNLRNELQTFRGHKRDVMRVSWHPVHENVFCSGSGDGAIFFWAVGSDTELSAIDDAHESMIWSLAWHPLGHILVSGANDFQTKFWTRDRPGDLLKENANASGPMALHNPINYPGPKNLDQSVTDSVISDHTNEDNSAVNKVSSKLPDFIPLKTEFEDVAFQSDLSQPSIVSIPGINEGTVENLNVLSTSANDEKKRSGKSIPKDFAANWASASMNVIQKPATIIPPHQQENMMAVAVGMAAVANSVTAMKMQMENERNRPPYPSYQDAPASNGKEPPRPYPDDGPYPPNGPPLGMPRRGFGPPPVPMRHGPPPPPMSHGNHMPMRDMDRDRMHPNFGGDLPRPMRPPHPSHDPFWRQNDRGPPPPMDRAWDEENRRSHSRFDNYGPPPKYPRDEYYGRGPPPPREFRDHRQPPMPRDGWSDRGHHGPPGNVSHSRRPHSPPPNSRPPPTKKPDDSKSNSTSNLPPRREWPDRGQRPPPSRRDW